MAMAMKGAMGVALAMAIALSMVLTVMAQEGACNADNTCPDPSLCCSQFGFCGTGDPYCGTGCKGGPCDGAVNTAGECNPDNTCNDPSLCCSQFGFCGTGPAWCGPGCKGGPCDGAVNTAGECNPDNTCNDPSLCCSQFGFCGTGPAWCGPGCKGGPCDGAVNTAGECNPDNTCNDPSLCCSQFGFCGTGPPWCGPGCKGGPCDPTTASSPSGGNGLGDVLTRNLYEQLFPGHLSFYSYDKFIEAAKLFPQFGTTGDSNTRKREIAAFAAHVTQETSGLKAIVEQSNDPYCDSSRAEFPCNGKHFNGRGPLQLTWNYNYGTCGNYLKINLLGNPDLVATDALISFKSSLWFWNRYGDNVIPHIHDVITGNWKPNNADKAANRVPGFGVTIEIINGNLECGKQSTQADNRVRYFKDFCKRLNVSPGDNLDCKKMKPFYGGIKLVTES